MDDRPDSLWVLCWVRYLSCPESASSERYPSEHWRNVDRRSKAQSNSEVLPCAVGKFHGLAKRSNVKYLSRRYRYVVFIQMRAHVFQCNPRFTSSSKLTHVQYLFTRQAILKCLNQLDHSCFNWSHIHTSYSQYIGCTVIVPSPAGSNTTLILTPRRSPTVYHMLGLPFLVNIAPLLPDC
jgi:hypothetical protein